jgi:hypothetical protein
MNLIIHNQFTLKQYKTENYLKVLDYKRLIYKKTNKYNSNLNFKYQRCLNIKFREY